VVKWSPDDLRASAQAAPVPVRPQKWLVLVASVSSGTPQSPAEVIKGRIWQHGHELRTLDFRSQNIQGDTHCPGHDWFLRSRSRQRATYLHTDVRRQLPNTFQASLSRAPVSDGSNSAQSRDRVRLIIGGRSTRPGP